MLLRKTLGIFKKETLDSLRDRRSLGSSLMFSFFGPVVVAMLLSALASSQEQQSTLEVPIAGQQYAPNLVAFLEQRGAVVTAPPADTAADRMAAIRDGDVDFVLEIDPGFGEAFLDSRPATVRLLHDSSKSKTAVSRTRLISWLHAYNTDVAQLRLLARGIDPGITQPLDIQPVDYASAMARAALVLGSLPIFFLLSTFIGGMNVAIDVTAGERERGSLESLLVHAVPSRVLAIGKWLATVLFNLVGVALTLTVSVVVLNAVSFEGLGVQVHFGSAEALGVLAILVPLALLAPAMQMAIAIFSRNFKEAQTYMSLLLFVPMVPGFLLSLDLLPIEGWMKSVPILGQMVQIFDLVRGETITAAAFWGCAAATLAATVLMVALTGVLFGREKIVLAR